MPRNRERHRSNGNEQVNLPLPRYRVRVQHSHHDDNQNVDGERVLELLEHHWDFVEEGRIRSFLAGSTPLHVDAEEMRQDSLGDVQGETTDENTEDRDPFEAFPESGQECLFARTIADDPEGEVTETVEDDDDGEEDGEGVEVVVVEGTVEPTSEEVVEECEPVCSADGVVCADVCHDGEL